MQPPGDILWICGLSGAGKTTLALEMAGRLRAQGRAVVMLDGDELREVFGAAANNNKNHGREGRLALAFQYAHLCRIIVGQGLTVVIATISLFHEIYAWNRTNLPNYFEVYLKVPIEELRRRDSKSIYSRFDSGELADVAGLDLPIDEPETADWVVEFDPSRSISAVAECLMKQLKERDGR
ncbi:MAG: adenylyl-sulfate kinase [Desulfobulbaceae bacterium]|nr:adenylyl-sulfate kinase [Desulfobulbaceae bacterium]